MIPGLLNQHPDFLSICPSCTFWFNMICENSCSFHTFFPQVPKMHTIFLMKNSRHDFQGYYINMLSSSLFVHPVTRGSDFMSPYRRSRSMHAQDVTPCHVISRPHLWPIETLDMGINDWYVISRHLKRYQNSPTCRWSGIHWRYRGS